MDALAVMHMRDLKQDCQPLSEATEVDEFEATRSDSDQGRAYHTQSLVSGNPNFAT